MEALAGASLLSHRAVSAVIGRGARLPSLLSPFERSFSQMGTKPMQLALARPLTFNFSLVLTFIKPLPALSVSNK